MVQTSCFQFRGIGLISGILIPIYTPTNIIKNGSSNSKAQIHVLSKWDLIDIASWHRRVVVRRKIFLTRRIYINGCLLWCQELGLDWSLELELSQLILTLMFGRPFIIKIVIPYNISKE